MFFLFIGRMEGGLSLNGSIHVWGIVQWKESFVCNHLSFGADTV